MAYAPKRSKGHKKITYGEGRALPEAIENALRALFCEKNGFNMGVNERGLGRFSFRPKSPRRGGAI